MSDMFTVAKQLVKGCQTLVMGPTSLLQQSLVNTVPHNIIEDIENNNLWAIGPVNEYLTYTLIMIEAFSISFDHPSRRGGVNS